MKVTKRVAKYCRSNGIVWEYEGEYEVEFTAPEGSVFPNESSWRIIDIEEMTIDQTLLALTLTAN